MNVFQIPELLDYILSYLSDIDKINLLKCNKYIYTLMPSYTNKIRNNLIFIKHYNLGRYILEYCMFLEYTHTILSQRFGKTHKYTNTIKHIYDALTGLQLNLNFIASEQCQKYNKAVIHCYYDTIDKDIIDNPLKELEHYVCHNFKLRCQLKIINAKNIRRKVISHNLFKLFDILYIELTNMLENFKFLHNITIVADNRKISTKKDYIKLEKYIRQWQNIWNYNPQKNQQILADPLDK